FLTPGFEIEELEDESAEENDEESERSEMNYVAFKLEIGNKFEDWDLAERQVQNHAMEAENSEKYCAKKKADTENVRECENIKLNYMLKEVEFLVNIGCGASIIICGLQKCFPNAIIYPKNVYHAINMFKCSNKVLRTDASETYDKLMQLQYKENGWFVERVESYNALIKQTIKSTTTLFELDTQIQLQLDREEQFERQEEQSNKNLTVGLLNITDRYFKKIDIMIKKYLTPRVLKMQCCQMSESLLYCTSKVENWNDLLDYRENVTNNNELEENAEGYESELEEDADNSKLEKQNYKRNNAAKFEFAEDDYESALLNLNSLIAYLDHANVHERAINLALQMGCKDEINQILQHWIKEKEKKICDEQLEDELEFSKENRPCISNPYQTRIKGAQKKHKNILNDVTKDHKKIIQQQNNKSIRTSRSNVIESQSKASSFYHGKKYMCSYYK
ncbi:17000_t:CDS:2, partial [Cetraspora pellucida]